MWTTRTGTRAGADTGTKGEGKRRARHLCQAHPPSSRFQDRRRRHRGACRADRPYRRTTLASAALRGSCYRRRRSCQACRGARHRRHAAAVSAGGGCPQRSPWRACLGNPWWHVSPRPLVPSLHIVWRLDQVKLNIHLFRVGILDTGNR